jgi:uncharacterized membrane protein YjfL (UPF0719 family)
MGIEIVLLNFVYAFVGIMFGIGTMVVGYKILDKLTHFRTAYELEKGNVAVGLMVLGIFLGVGLCALTVGLALN